MSRINAFVGHSFTSNDADIVRKFLQYFDQVANLHRNFSWVHAENAEPRELTKKVFELIEDKNLFIGICTKKEMALDASYFSRLPFFAKALVKSDKVQWKTSDWIIQEIGMAKGRNMDLLLLIEEGVRKPGGLQGDVEYISFSREAPEKAFGKIVEMITALSPKIAQQLPTDGTAASSTEPIQVETASNEIFTPALDWTEDKYDLALFRATVRKEDDKVRTIDAAFRASAFGNTPEAIAIWESHKSFYQCIGGLGNNHLATLRSLAEKHPNTMLIRANYARAFRYFKNHKEAASEFLATSQIATSTKDKLEFMGQAAHEFRAANKDDAANKIIESIRNIGASENGEEFDLLEALLDAHEQKDNDYSLALRERLMELNPEDNDRRFSLAYDQSEHSNQDVALYHYQRIPSNDRTSVGWNNLGVSFQHFQMSCKSIQAFRCAESMNDTLAMANLGNRLLSAGFLKEAQDICDRALTFGSYHKNVGHLLARLQDIPDEEKRLEESVTKTATEKIEFYRAFGRAFAHTSIESLVGEWIGPDCLLRFEYASLGTLRLYGSHEKPANLAPLALIGTSQSRITEDVEYSGNINGQAMVTYVTRRSNNLFQPSLLDGLGNKALMYVSNEGSELKVLESPSSTGARFYTLRRVENTLQLSSSPART